MHSLHHSVALPLWLPVLSTAFMYCQLVKPSDGEDPLQMSVQVWGYIKKLNLWSYPPESEWTRRILGKTSVHGTLISNPNISRWEDAFPVWAMHPLTTRNLHLQQWFLVPHVSCLQQHNYVLDLRLTIPHTLSFKTCCCVWQLNLCPPTNNTIQKVQPNFILQKNFPGPLQLFSTVIIEEKQLAIPYITQVSSS